MIRLSMHGRLRTSYLFGSGFGTEAPTRGCGPSVVTGAKSEGSGSDCKATEVRLYVALEDSIRVIGPPGGVEVAMFSE